MGSIIIRARIWDPVNGTYKWFILMHNTARVKIVSYETEVFVEESNKVAIRWKQILLSRRSDHLHPWACISEKRQVRTSLPIPSKHRAVLLLTRPLKNFFVFQAFGNGSDARTKIRACMGDTPMRSMTTIDAKVSRLHLSANTADPTKLFRRPSRVLKIYAF